MDTNKILSIGLIAAIGYMGYKIYLISSAPRVGDTCGFAEGGPDGYITYSFQEVNEKPKLKCRRCNTTGCASYDIKKNIYGK
jgi:hypothetical protein